MRTQARTAILGALHYSAPLQHRQTALFGLERIPGSYVDSPGQ